jgi:hypothetical protein
MNKPATFKMKAAGFTEILALKRSVFVKNPERLV